ncbi:MAG: hypothetical protein IKC65_02190, partial [Lentisphaeria bacterium]|nr:hypothetical protein [Lentisphaeria bacterium]
MAKEYIIYTTKYLPSKSRGLKMKHDALNTEQTGRHFISHTVFAAAKKHLSFLAREGSFERMGTDKYGRVRSQTQPQTAGITHNKNTPLFFESERGFGGKRKPS